MAKATRKQRATSDEEETLSTREGIAVIVVAVLLIAGAALAWFALSTGNLYVLVEANGNAPSGYTPLVCVYAGNQTEALSSGDASAIPQAEAAVLVELGTETKIEGRWRGTYTIAVMNATGTVDPSSCILTTQVGKGDTHVGIMLDGDSIEDAA